MKLKIKNWYNKHDLDIFGIITSITIITLTIQALF